MARKKQEAGADAEHHLEREVDRPVGECRGQVGQLVQQSEDRGRDQHQAA